MATVMTMDTITATGTAIATGIITTTTDITTMITTITGMVRPAPRFRECRRNG